MRGARVSVVAMSCPQVRSVRARRNQHQREQTQREGGGVEDMRVLAVALPPHELFTHEPGGQHEELQVEPVVAEPEKQVRAEDDRERPEA